MNRLKMSAALAAALQVFICTTNASKYHFSYNFIDTPVREPRSFPEAETWQSLSVVPYEITVSAKSEIDWNLKLPETVPLLANDCIEFTFVSPYEDADSYQSFDLEDSVTCYVSPHFYHTTYRVLLVLHGAYCRNLLCY